MISDIGDENEKEGGNELRGHVADALPGGAEKRAQEEAEGRAQGGAERRAQLGTEKSAQGEAEGCSQGGVGERAKGEKDSTPRMRMFQVDEEEG